MPLEAIRNCERTGVEVLEDGALAARQIRIPRNVGTQSGQDRGGIRSADHVDWSPRAHDENAAELPATQDRVGRRSPVGAECLPLAEGQIIGAAEDQVVADIGIRGCPFCREIVGILWAVVVDVAEVKGRWPIIQTVPIGVARQEAGVPGHLPRELHLQRVVVAISRVGKILDLAERGGQPVVIIVGRVVRVGIDIAHLVGKMAGERTHERYVKGYRPAPLTLHGKVDELVVPVLTVGFTA